MRLMVVVVPSSWDELAEHILMGFTVNTFTWEQAMECLASPSWSLVHIITTVRAALSTPLVYITSTDTSPHDPTSF